MKRSSAGDRVAVFFVGLLCLGIGGVGVGWYQRLIPGLSQTNYAPQVAELNFESWWPLAVFATGAICVLWGLTVIFSRVGRERIGNLRLAGSGAAGQLSTVPSKVAKVAAAELQDTMGVSSVKGKAMRVHGQNVIELRVVAVDLASMSQLKESIHSTVSNTRVVIGDRAVVRVLLDVGASKSEPGPRVL